MVLERSRVDVTMSSPPVPSSTRCTDKVRMKKSMCTKMTKGGSAERQPARVLYLAACAAPNPVRMKKSMCANAERRPARQGRDDEPATCTQLHALRRHGEDEEEHVHDRGAPTCPPGTRPEPSCMCCVSTVRMKKSMCTTAER